MKKISFVPITAVIAFAIVCTLVGCPDGSGGGSGGGSGNITGGEGVYVCGIYRYIDNNDYPCIWKDGKLFKLEIHPGSNFGSVSGIAVSGKDIYAVGQCYNGSIYSACYWKNGKIYDLHPDPAMASSRANRIVVLGNNVYVGGYYQKGFDAGGRICPCYWKDGVFVDLPMPPSTWDCSVCDIASTGTDVILIGNHADTDEGNYRGCYWKASDNSFTVLEVDGYTLNDANNITTVGSDFYIIGDYGWLDTNNKYVSNNCYWKNGVYQDDSKIPNGANISLGRFTVAGQDLYIAGSTFIEDYIDHNLTYIYTAQYWKNGVSQYIPVPYETVQSRAGAIALSGQDIYIAGVLDRVACYWKNGEITYMEYPDYANYCNTGAILVVE